MSFFAYETWFTDMTPSDRSFAFEVATLALLGLAVVVTLLVRVVAQRFPGVDEWPWGRPRLGPVGSHPAAASRT